MNQSLEPSRYQLAAEKIGKTRPELANRAAALARQMESASAQMQGAAPGQLRAMNQQLHDHIVANNRDAEGKAALSAMTSELNPSVFKGITDQFYDPAKGGVQLGGLIGGLIGGAAALLMMGNTEFGPMATAGVAAVMAMGGAWGANKLTENMGKPETPPVSQREVAKARSQARVHEIMAQNKSREKALPEEVKKRALAGNNPQLPVDHPTAQTGPVAPGTTPLGTVNEPSRGPNG